MATKQSAAKPTPAKSLARPLAWLLVVGGAIGLVASYVVTLDKLKLLENPAFRPTCDLNPVISCGGVMQSAQAKVFGFPNPWIGLAAFAVLVTVGMGLLAGAKFKRWFWLTMYAFIILGLVFALWLLFESIYSINALCPYCLGVDVVVITLAWYSTLYLLEAKYLHLPASWGKIAGFVRRHHLDILVVVFAIIIAIILNHFWYYYGQYL